MFCLFPDKRNDRYKIDINKNDLPVGNQDKSSSHLQIQY